MADQEPLPTALTARTWMSYSIPFVRLDKVYCRFPEVQIASRSVQLASVLFGASLRM